jgi:DNA polymerase sigma
VLRRGSEFDQSHQVFGSFATGLALPISDLDILVRLPRVRTRTLEPIVEANILEGHNTNGSAIQQAARKLAQQEWLVADSLRTIENTTIPLISLKVHDPRLSADGGGGGAGAGHEDFVRVDISFEAENHRGVETVALVRGLAERYPPLSPLALVLKQLLHEQSLDHSYTGGLSSYCLVLLIARFLQSATDPGTGAAPLPSADVGADVGAAAGWGGTRLGLGRLLLDFLHFYGEVFDPRRTVVRLGLGRRGMLGDQRQPTDSLGKFDPLYIDDPLSPAENNVGKGVFRVYQVAGRGWLQAFFAANHATNELPPAARERGDYRMTSPAPPRSRRPSSARTPCSSNAWPSPRR